MADVSSECIRFEYRVGSGAFGEVHAVTDLRIDTVRACKIINKSRLQVPIEQVGEEIKILKSVDHPNVIKIFEIFEDPNSIYIIQEFCRGSQLLSTLMIDEGMAAVHDEALVRRVMRQIVAGVAHIHAKRIIHK